MKPGRFHDIADELARNKDYYEVLDTGSISCDKFAIAHIDGTITIRVINTLGVHNARRAYDAIGRAIWLIEHHWIPAEQAAIQDKLEALRGES
jgi:hypothetical protein